MLGDEQPADHRGDGEGSPDRAESKRGGWPKGKPRKLKEQAMAETPQLDAMEALKAILAQMSESNREQMMEFAKELRKSTEREQRKIDEEDKKIKSAQLERLELAKADEQRKLMNARGCG